jgi:hypothetical protein
MSISSKLSTIVGAAVSLLVAAPAFAGTIIPSNKVPEPGTLALVGLAAAVGYVVTRNKKK